MDLSTPEQININSIEQSVQPDRFSGVEILVVDDEVDSLDILTLVLEEEGATVIPVKSAALAMEALNQTTPDLIISDIGMPDTDGYTLISQIRQLPQGQNIPAMAFSAYGNEIDRQQTLAAGFQKHIAKPINIPKIIAIITELLQ